MFNDAEITIISKESRIVDRNYAKRKPVITPFEISPIKELNNSPYKHAKVQSFDQGSEGIQVFSRNSMTEVIPKLKLELIVKNVSATNEGN